MSVCTSRDVCLEAAGREPHLPADVDSEGELRRMAVEPGLAQAEPLRCDVDGQEFVRIPTAADDHRPGKQWGLERRQLDEQGARLLRCYLVETLRMGR